MDQTLVSIDFVEQSLRSESEQLEDEAEVDFCEKSAPDAICELAVGQDLDVGLILFRTTVRALGVVRLNLTTAGEAIVNLWTSVPVVENYLEK